MFIAIGLPGPVKNYVTSLYDHSVAGIGWTPKEDLHLTMRFLGDIGDDEEERLLQVLGKARVSPFTLMVGGVGAFPRKGPPKVIWLGLDTGHPLLFQLRQRIDDAVLAAGIECEMRDFVPHITIGRCSVVSAQSIRTLFRSKTAMDGPLFSVCEFTLFESRRAPTGSCYLPVESFPLGRV